MPNVHTLRDIENREVVEGPLSKHTPSGSRNAKNWQKKWREKQHCPVTTLPSGNRLDSIRKSELEKALRGNIKTASDIANDYKDLQDIYLERVKESVQALTISLVG
ncbi:hypothetical protein GLOIN_2v1790954 [Rhizophagus irregularis DAOM 181602=DAOM 197198]|nr:hypothetical protein GLOIN_2v1790954 [Rhizophagus irregularis DAOM 181602=DAOM 197198]